MDKYYTPIIEEFYVGFEYEVKTWKDKWETEILIDLNSQDSDGALYPWIPTEQSLSCFRVKYLDKEDIESLGFTKRLKNQWVGWKDYIKEISNHNYEYFMRFTLHTPTMGSQYKIYVHRHLHSEQDDIEGQLNYGESELVYKGLIKNKSELLKLLKQLGIDG